MSSRAPILIGERDDPHIAAVEDALIRCGNRPLIFDLESVMSDGLSLSDEGYAVKIDGAWRDLTDARFGWLRRLHRADWGLGIEAGSLRALELGTWYSAYSWLLDDSKVSWITSPVALRRAESKLWQWKAAVRLGIPYPRTLVTTSSEAVATSFSNEVIVKPLGTGQFIQDGETMTVYAESMMPTDIRLNALNAAPFIVQERIPAAKHLRVVTVGDRSWVATLDVDLTAPADWRRRSRNHSAFKEAPDASSIAPTGALTIASHLGLGYSSQDWVQTPDGEVYLLDVNPSGQWLFLPERVGTAVTDALADLLVVAT